MNAAPQAKITKSMLDDRALIYRLLRLVNLLSRPFQERFGTRYDLSLTEWRVMMALAARPGTTATEIWTFVRPRGGRWELSAIQQTG